MWVRSQDRKRLSDCIEFYLQEKTQYRYAVLGCSKNSNGHIIGVYENIQKATKVLDMIQEKTMQPIYKNYISDNEVAIYKEEVFQMPQDNEVTL